MKNLKEKKEWAINEKHKYLKESADCINRYNTVMNELIPNLDKTIIEIEKQLETEQSQKLKLEDFLPEFKYNELSFIGDGAAELWEGHKWQLNKYLTGVHFKTQQEAIYFFRRSIVLRLVDRMMLALNTEEKKEETWVYQLETDATYNTDEDEYRVILNNYFFNNKDAEKCLEFLSETKFDDGSKYIDYLILKNPIT